MSITIGVKGIQNNIRTAYAWMEGGRGKNCIHVLFTLPDTNNYLKIKIIILLSILKGQCHEIFYLYFCWSSGTLMNRLKTVANFFCFR